MYPRSLASVVLVLSFLFMLTDHAQAWPKRRRARATYRYSGDGLTQIAPKVDQGAEDYRALQVYYNYDRANAQQMAFPDRIRVFLLVRDENVLNAKHEIVAEVKVTDLSDYQTTCLKWCPVSLDRNPKGDYHFGFFDLTNQEKEESILEPARVYRLFVTLHRESEEYGKESALGRVPGPYYVATSGETHLDRARQQIVMRTFKEWYYRQRGWQSDEYYPMDCHAYYLWATGFCTVGATDGRADLGELFGSRTGYQNGSEIPELAGKGPIHGDYVRKPGHTFMLLSHDVKLNHVWTMEGNFNSTVEVAIRSVNSGWTVGHLADEHIRPRLFEFGEKHRVAGLLFALIKSMKQSIFR